MLRLCIDLNIWVAALLADCKGRSNTASQYLVELVRSGASPVGELSGVILKLKLSIAMLFIIHLLIAYKSFTPISWWNGLEAVKFQLLLNSIDVFYARSSLMVLESSN